MESGDVGELHFTKKPLLQWHSRTSTTSRMNKRWWNHTMNELPLTFSTCMPSYYDIICTHRILLHQTESMNTNVSDKNIWLWPPLANLFGCCTSLSLVKHYLHTEPFGLHLIILYIHSPLNHFIPDPCSATKRPPLYMHGYNCSPKSLLNNLIVRRQLWGATSI